MNNLRGAKIIYQESEATQPSHLYFLQKDENYCEAIVTSESGAKRKLNIDLSNYYTKNEVDVKFLDYYTKTEVDTALATKQANLGYTPENIANKSDSYTSSSSTNYASSKALVDGLATKLDKGTYTGTAQDLKNEIDSKQQKLLSSFDESILIETDGNIEGNVSLFQEYFEQQVCVLNFTPIQIIGVYLNGVKQKPSLYTITLPKTISVTNYTTGDYIEIQYTKLKS